MSAKRKRTRRVSTLYLVSLDNVEHLCMSEYVAFDHIVPIAARLAIVLDITTMVVPAVDARLNACIVYIVDAWLASNPQPLTIGDVNRLSSA